MKRNYKRTIVSLLLITALSCNESTTLTKNAGGEILLYFVNDKTLTLRPGQITETEFLGKPENLDTIKLKDTGGNYVRRFYALKDTVFYSFEEVDLFPHVFAFVFEHDGKVDTLYADGTSFFKDGFSEMSNVY